MNSQLTETQSSVAKQLVRIIIAEVAPEELRRFEHYASRYFENPEIEARLKSAERPGGVGNTEVFIVATYVVFKLLQPFLSSMVSGVGEEVKELTKSVASAMLEPYADQLIERIQKWHLKNGRDPKIDKLEKFIKQTKKKSSKAPK